jgi:hypothetical protein
LCFGGLVSDTKLALSLREALPLDGLTDRVLQARIHRPALAVTELDRLPMMRF